MKSLFKQNIILLLLIMIIIITPLILKGDSEFEGADGEAEGVIQEISPDYEPWFESLWEPPSGEIESLLFSLQVAIGAGLMGYIFGVLKERRKVVANR
ncbi:energy-coupling factor ABC transporter substrate-binding protein [Tissierella praeacuta]|uniref:energy-coupling factor ABC transporter substrate-binding protein n=1 Tax=Tissierella praeacuta TaxID=43131 RepID=UPI000ECEC4EA|nr:energy-coupling factor ABC transporter substrate-binding protein [Tissierella praeacuta]MBU5256627.1 energy-coupling factor ABC transporter substrate-binding protein [Tissierella praeacuta]HAE92138.1 energy-coupling factor ABC transporter substrate-binding protein [Tissierella sp.]